MESYRGVILTLLMLISVVTNAQNPSTFRPHDFEEDWSIGVNLHHNYLIGDLESLQRSEDKLNFGFGWQLAKQLSPSASLGFRYFGSRLNASPPQEFGDRYNFEVETDFDIYGVFGKFYFNRLREHIGRIPNSNIYGTVGISMIEYEYGLTGVSDSLLVVGHERQSDQGESWAFSVGAGIEQKLSERIFLDFSLVAYISNSDFLDGNPTYDLMSNNGDDIIMSTSLGLSYRFGTNRSSGYKWSNSFVNPNNSSLEANLLILVDDRLQGFEELNKIDTSLLVEFDDADGDSVADPFDLEKNTRPNALVNFQGIEIESKSNISNVYYESNEMNFDPVFFKLDRSDLDDKYLVNLVSVTSYLKENTNSVIRLVGHADESGDESYNMNLSKRRVEVIQRILMQHFGVNKNQLELDWKGESETISTNKDLNRRVDFYLK